jgi:hypothetical protein
MINELPHQRIDSFYERDEKPSMVQIQTLIGTMAVLSRINEDPEDIHQVGLLAEFLQAR